MLVLVVGRGGRGSGVKFSLGFSGNVTLKHYPFPRFVKSEQ